MRDRGVLRGGLSPSHREHRETVSVEEKLTSKGMKAKQDDIKSSVMDTCRTRDKSPV